MVVDRIHEIIDSKKISKSEFYRKTGLSNGFLDKVKDVGASKLEQILNAYPEVDPIWLLTGSGKMLGSSNITMKNDVKYEKYKIPLLPIEAMAGALSSPNVQVMDYETEPYYIPMFRNADFLIPVLGDSMYPTYNNGDIVACMRLETWTFFQYGKVYVINTNQGVLIKRILKSSEKDSIILSSDNEDYQPFEIHIKDLIGVALVIGGVWLE